MKYFYPRSQTEKSEPETDRAFYYFYLKHEAMINRRYDMRRHAGLVFHKLSVH